MRNFLKLSVCHAASFRIPFNGLNYLDVSKAIKCFGSFLQAAGVLRSSVLKCIVFWLFVVEVINLPIK